VATASRGHGLRHCVGFKRTRSDDTPWLFVRHERPAMVAAGADEGEKNDQAYHPFPNRTPRRRGASLEVRQPATDPVADAERATRTRRTRDRAGLSRTRPGGNEPPAGRAAGFHAVGNLRGGPRDGPPFLRAWRLIRRESP